MSGVLHWVYFTPIRKHTYAWNQFIIWGSFAGGLMCLTGLAIGIWRLSPSGRFRQKRQRSHSPYSGLMRWHHYAGLLFGVVTFTWIISGAFSVNPFGMFSGGGGLGREDRQALTGGPLTLESVSLEDLRAGVAAIGAHFRAKQIDLVKFRGELYLTADRPRSELDPPAPVGLAEHRKVALSRRGDPTFVTFDQAEIEAIADQIMAGVPVRDRVWLDAYDNYYRSRDGSRPLPVLRVRYLDDARTWVYLDPHRGDLLEVTRHSRLNRWLYAALHEFDFPFLYQSRPLWDIVVISLSLGGIVLGATTLWPMLKRFRRHARRLARMATRLRTRTAPEA
jgi:hypothetical protein